MKPNLPQTKIKKAIVDNRLSTESRILLESFDIKLIDSICINSIADSTFTHPDMQISVIDDSTAIVCQQAIDHYSKHLESYKLIPMKEIASPYPFDSLINVTVVDKYCFATPLQWELIKDIVNKKHIEIKQGYSKCNICILNDHSIITSDLGIIKQAEKNSIKAYYLPSDEIMLNGYKNGFWGGCSGLIAKDKLFFNGDITLLSCYNRLMDILDKEKIEPIFHKKHQLCDVGSIIPVI